VRNKCRFYASVFLIKKKNDHLQRQARDKQNGDWMGVSKRERLLQAAARSSALPAQDGRCGCIRALDGTIRVRAAAAGAENARPFFAPFSFSGYENDHLPRHARDKVKERWLKRVALSGAGGAGRCHCEREHLLVQHSPGCLRLWLGIV
jgi:hypothetical protein